MRITFLQYGDYGYGLRRLAEGGGEIFFGQRYTVDYVGSLVERAEDVSQVCFSEDLAPEVLPNGVHQAGIRQWPERGRPRTREVIELVLARRPTHLILATPQTPVLRAARKAGVDVFPLLADSFRAPGPRAALRYRWLAHNLRHPAIRWVSNHNLEASRDLERIGVPAEKIVPFDWPPLVRPSDFAPKAGPADPAAPRLLYVGQVTAEKGVGDLVEAAARLVADGNDLSLTVIGIGDGQGAFEARARELGVAERVAFTGRQPHDAVIAAMHAHDVVLVPSRHEYPEGLPMVIYEGLCSRSPLVVSDHPMFQSRLRDGRDCLVFPAGDVGALASAIAKLLGDRALYAELSRHAETVCDGFFVGAPWAEMIDHWLGGSAEDDAWLAGRSLASPRFR